MSNEGSLILGTSENTKQKLKQNQNQKFNTLLNLQEDKRYVSVTALS